MIVIAPARKPINPRSRTQRDLGAGDYVKLFGDFPQVLREPQALLCLGQRVEVQAGRINQCLELHQSLGLSQP